MSFPEKCARRNIFLNHACHPIRQVRDAYRYFNQHTRGILLYKAYLSM